MRNGNEEIRNGIEEMRLSMEKLVAVHESQKLAHCIDFLSRETMAALSLASQTLFPMLVGVAGSAAGRKGLVSLGHIPLQRGMQ